MNTLLSTITCMALFMGAAKADVEHRMRWSELKTRSWKKPKAEGEGRSYEAFYEDKNGNGQYFQMETNKDQDFWMTWLLGRPDDYEKRDSITDTDIDNIDLVLITDEAKPAANILGMKYKFSDGSYLPTFTLDDYISKIAELEYDFYQGISKYKKTKICKNHNIGDVFKYVKKNNGFASYADEYDTNLAQTLRKVNSVDFSKIPEAISVADRAKSRLRDWRESVVRPFISLTRNIPYTRTTTEEHHRRHSSYRVKVYRDRVFKGDHLEITMKGMEVKRNYDGGFQKKGRRYFDTTTCYDLAESKKLNYDQVGIQCGDFSFITNWNAKIQDINAEAYKLAGITFGVYSSDCK